MKRDDSIYLRHILDAIKDIEDSTGKISRKEFDINKDVKDATLRRIEIIGEAVKNISENTREKNKKIEWKKIAGARDMIIHSYFNVDWDLVWDILEKDLKILKKQVIELLNNIEKKN